MSDSGVDLMKSVSEHQKQQQRTITFIQWYLQNGQIPFIGSKRADLFISIHLGWVCSSLQSGFRL